MMDERASIAVTGAAGFIGSNLCLRLREANYRVHAITRQTPADEAALALRESAVIFHLAGVNRDPDPHAVVRGNLDAARAVADAVRGSDQVPLIVFASSSKAGEPGAYGESKLAAEHILQALGHEAVVSIWRLPNVFGKWARPDTNSALATFCHTIARGLPIRVDDQAGLLDLLYIDDLIDCWLDLVAAPVAGIVIPRGHVMRVGDLAAAITAIARGRKAGEIGTTGHGFARALYATYVSHLPECDFAYPLTGHTDARGHFVEAVRTPESGQFAVMTAHPGVTRGGHYHHAKVEKFLVVAGQARFRFRHVLTGKTVEIDAHADTPQIVETIPGWTHDVTNTGTGPLVALIWASECFDRARPDTMEMPL